MARERGEAEEGVPEKALAEGVFVTSAWEGSHGGTSPLVVQRAPLSPSGSGEDFLFRPRRYFLSGEEAGEESAQAGKPERQESRDHQHGSAKAHQRQTKGTSKHLLQVSQFIRTATGPDPSGPGLDRTGPERAP